MNLTTLLDIEEDDRPRCRCGSTEHKKVNHSQCVLNKKNLKNLSQETIDELTTAHNKRILKKSNADSNKHFNMARRGDKFVESDVGGENVQTDPSKPNYARHELKPRDQECEHCGAKHWKEDRTISLSSKTKYGFSSCCANGKVKIPPSDPLDPLLIRLLDDSHFMSKIRFYNAAFSFVSFNANSDQLLSKGNVYTYRVQGMIHHRIGPLTQDNDDYKKQCAQIYILDGEQQEELRKNYSPDLNTIVLKNLRLMLEFDCKNPFVNKFKTAASLYKSNPSLDLKISIITDKSVDRRIYNKPTATEIAVLIPSMGERGEATE